MNRFEWLIAGRYVFSRKRINLINIISVISIAGMTVGVASLIVVLSVFNGFSTLVGSLLKGLDPDIRIESATGDRLSVSDSVLIQALREEKSIVLSAPFIEEKGLLVRGQNHQVAWLYGMDDSLFKKMVSLDLHMVAGLQNVAGNEQDQRGMVMGIALADQLDAMVHDTIAVLSPVGLDKVFTQMQAPRTKRLQMTGMYQVQRVYDIGFSYISFEAAADLFRYRDEMTGVAIRLSPEADAADVKERLQSRLGSDYEIRTWYDLRRNMYSIMQLEKWGAYFILTLLIVIAAFNVVGTLMMTVLEKRRDIGILMSMGSSREQIYRIFLNQGLLVGLSGVGMGSLLGYGVVWLQQLTGWYKIPNSENFIIDSFPVAVEWTDFLAVTSISLLLAVLSAIYPARMATRLDPIEAIRYE